MRPDTRRAIVLPASGQASRMESGDRRSALRYQGEAGIQKIRGYLDQVFPEAAQALTDYLLITLRGLSAAACSGISPKRLVAVAQIAGKAISEEFKASGVAADS
jgi:TetR/AcrR family transcriptional repressor for divergent bdcA